MTLNYLDNHLTLKIGKLPYFKREVFLNFDVLKKPLLIVGRQGVGKSNLVLLIMEKLLKKDIPVVIFDKKRSKMEKMRALGANVTALYPHHSLIQKHLIDTDLLIGAVLIPGDKAPHIVSEQMVKTMQKGSVIIDISVDQGGCIETTHPTTYEQPTYIQDDIVHFAVTNMPGAVPKTSSQALSAAIMPFVHKLAENSDNPDVILKTGINISNGEIVHPVIQKLYK